jgi:antitoxin component HigA of HigAB toxin-antitoxin module
MTEIESTQLAEEKFNIHMISVGLASPDDSPLFGKDDQDILETEEEEEEKEKDGETITPELMVGVDISVDEDAVSHERSLYLEAEAEAEAEAGLREILDQFRLNAAEIDEIIGSFQNFIVATQQIFFFFFEADSQKNRYVWAISHDNEQIHEILSDVDQRLEDLMCNEFVTERTNSTMKRMLSPFRLRMSPDVLLPQLTIASHGNVASSKLPDSVGSDDLVHD